jgi:hypothetical protein
MAVVRGPSSARMARIDTAARGRAGGVRVPVRRGIGAGAAARAGRLHPRHA